MDAVTWAGCPHGTSSREKHKEETVFSCRRPRKGPWQVAWAARWVNGSQHPCPLRASLPAQPPEGRVHWVCSQPVPPGPQTESPAHPPGATGSRSEHGAGSPRSERGEACALRPLGSGRGQESPSLDPTSHQLQWLVSLATENLAGGGFGGRGTQLPCVRSQGRAPSGAAGSAARPRCSVLLALRSAKGVWAQKSLWMSLVTQAQPVHSQCSHHDTRLAWPLISRRPGSPSRQATGQEWDGTVSSGFGTNRGTGEGQPSSLKSVLFSQKSRQPRF